MGYMYFVYIFGCGFMVGKDIGFVLGGYGLGIGGCEYNFIWGCVGVGCDIVYD